MVYRKARHDLLFDISSRFIACSIFFPVFRREDNIGSLSEKPFCLRSEDGPETTGFSYNIGKPSYSFYPIFPAIRREDFIGQEMAKVFDTDLFKSTCS
jgi:hypothetical protein